MFSTDHHELVYKIHSSGHQLVVAITGGGSGAVSALLQTPGASRTVLEAVVPYSFGALVDWIGGKPDQACSESTARAMAMAAFMRARALSPNADTASLVGVGFTGSLATDRVKRGERRMHLAAQRADRTEVHSIRLTDHVPDEIQASKPWLARAMDESCATTTLLWLIARSFGVPVAQYGDKKSDLWQGRIESASHACRDLLLGARRSCVVGPGPLIEALDRDEATLPTAIFPGSFNPPHAGHFKMAAIAEAELQRPLLWELSVTNVDKPPLDFITIRDRVTALRVDEDARPIALTRAATFREKAELFPGATFVVGADTMLRIADPRYYNDDAAVRDGAIFEIADRGGRFLVFGREVNGRFLALGDLNLPSELRRLCEEVPASAFREDVSSTELRKGTP